MIGFDKIEIAVRTGDGRNFTSLEPFTFTHPCGESYTVEAGATSDGASSPREMWCALPPFGAYWLAAFLHDDLYRRSNWPKEKCDAWFLAAMEWLNVSEGERVPLYQGVHVFGQESFNEDRNHG